MPLRASKSARCRITGMSAAGLMSTFMSSVLVAQRGGLDAARAHQHDVAPGRRYTGEGGGPHAVDAVERRAVVGAEAHVAALADEQQAAVVGARGGGDAGAHAGVQSLPAAAG